jgi:hypothetical protein
MKEKIINIILDITDWCKTNPKKALFISAVIIAFLVGALLF